MKSIELMGEDLAETLSRTITNCDIKNKKRNKELQKLDKSLPVTNMKLDY